MDLKFFDSEISMPLGMVILPLRSTLVPLPDGGNALISPIDFTPEQISDIEDMGPVTHVISPCLIHHLYMKKAIERFKPHQVWGAPGCRTKLPDIPWTHVFELDPWPYEKDLSTCFIAGVSRLNEVAFNHRPTGTLICADFVFNVTEPRGWAAPIVMRMLGTYKRFAVSKLMNKFLEDRELLEESLARLMAWDFERVAMGHGDLVTHDGHEMVEASLRERGFLNQSAETALA